MFEFAKKKEKEREFFIHLIEKIDTLELQNQFMFERIQCLEMDLQQHHPFSLYNARCWLPIFEMVLQPSRTNHLIFRALTRTPTGKNLILV